MEENKIGDTLNEAAEAAKDVSENAAEAAENVVEDAVEAAENVAENAAEAAENVAENAAETAENVVEDAVEAAENVAENAVEAAENVANDAVDVAGDAAEDAVETAENAVDNVEEGVDAIKEEAADASKAYDPTELKGKKPNSEPVEVKKGRKPMKKGAIIGIVVAAVVVVAALLFIGFNNGWFKFLTNKGGNVELADLSRIEVVKEDIEVTDDTIEYYINSVLASQSTTETVEDGTVEDGDTVNIDYVGVRDDTGEAFDGGSAEGYDLSIGSGSFIDDFEEQLIGAKPGDVKEVKVTFPEDYAEESLAGQDATFTVTVNSINRTHTPELTDEWVKEYSAKYCPETYNTVDEFRNYAKDTVVDYYLHQAMYQSIADKSTIKEYNTEDETMLKDYSNQNLEYYASMYGMDADSYATMMGQNSAEEYNLETAHQYQDIQMIVDEIFKQKNLSYTEEELNEAIVQYMKDNRYNDMYELDEFINQSGDTWMWLFTNLEFKFDKAMEALEDNVVVLEERPTTEEDLTAEADEEGLDVDMEDVEIEEITDPADADAEDVEVVVEETSSN